MDENKIGQFIVELRKEKNMTQKDLAAQLHITDKAVSKWERGLSCPDISLLTSLAGILGVTTGELLNGQRSRVPSDAGEQSVDTALVYAEKTAARKAAALRNRGALSFSVLLLIGVMVCLICDMAISGKLTWSWYPVSSILFTWVVLIPFVKCGRKGLPGSLAALSVSIIPFLYVIDRIIGRTSILPVAVPIALLSVVYLWCVYWIFRKRNTGKLSAGGWSLLLAIPLCLGINWIISRFFSEPVLDIWDMVAFAVLTVSAVALWIVDYRKNQKG